MPKIANLGSGTKASSDERVINIDWSLYLRLKRQPALRLIAKPFLSESRRTKLGQLPDNVIPHDLRKGIPFPSESLDAVYHSHFLEHMDREAVPAFLAETKRVLRPGGVQRIVIPDFEHLCREYLGHIETSRKSGAEAKLHDQYVGAILEQCVRTVPSGVRAESGPAALLDRLVAGDARRRGEVHRWMYDFTNLSVLLKEAGFQDVRRVDWKTSAIQSWDDIGLDKDNRGEEYKPNSLYVECNKWCGERGLYISES